MKLLPKQNNAIYYLKDDETTELVYGGAAGGGKSSLGCIWLIENCQKFEGSRWFMGRSVLKKLKETTLKTFFDESDKLKVTHQWEYKQQEGLIKWKNGSEIVLIELKYYPKDPDYDYLGSLEVTGGFIDEIPQIKFKAWTVSKSRIRYRLKDYCHECGIQHKKEVLEFKTIGDITIPDKWVCSKGHETKGLTPKLLGSCNPTKNWVYKYFFKPWRLKDLPIFRKFIQSLPSDNPYLPDSYIISLDQMDEASRRRLKDGDWEYDDDKSAIIGYDAIMNYFNPGHIEPGDRTYLTIDVARKGKDKTILRVWKGWLCVKRYEMLISKTTQVTEKARKIQAAFKIKNSDTVADEDGVGGGVVDELGCRGFVNNSRPIWDAEAEDGDINYENLKTQCSVRIAQRIVAGTMGEICKNSEVEENTSEEMEQIKRRDMDKDGKIAIVRKDEIKASIGRSPDEWDSIMMREIFEIEDRTSFVISN